MLQLYFCKIFFPSGVLLSGSDYTLKVNMDKIFKIVKYNNWLISPQNQKLDLTIQNEYEVSLVSFPTPQHFSLHTFSSHCSFKHVFSLEHPRHCWKEGHHSSKQKWVGRISLETQFFLNRNETAGGKQFFRPERTIFDISGEAISL